MMGRRLKPNVGTTAARNYAGKPASRELVPVEPGALDRGAHSATLND
jgi:hypothetical protein